MPQVVVCVQRSFPCTHDKNVILRYLLSQPMTDNSRYMNKEIEMLSLPTSLTELLGPVFEFFQALFAHTGTDVGQTGVEVFDADGPDVFWRHVK